jgi:hypothetical protein
VKGASTSLLIDVRTQGIFDHAMVGRQVVSEISIEQTAIPSPSCPLRKLVFARTEDLRAKRMRKESMSDAEAMTTISGRLRITTSFHKDLK